MPWRLSSCLMVLVLWSAGLLSPAQTAVPGLNEIIVTGSVTDDAGQPLKDVTVRATLFMARGWQGKHEDQERSVGSPFELRFSGVTLAAVDLVFVKEGHLGVNHHVTTIMDPQNAVPMVNGRARKDGLKVVLTRLPPLTALNHYERLALSDVEDGPRRVVRLAALGPTPPDLPRTRTARDRWRLLYDGSLVLRSPSSSSAADAPTTHALELRMVDDPATPPVLHTGDWGETTTLFPGGRGVELLADDGADGGIILLSRNTSDPQKPHATLHRRMDDLLVAPESGYQKKIRLTPEQIREFRNGAGMFFYLKANGFYGKGRIEGRFRDQWQERVRSSTGESREQDRRHTGIRFSAEVELFMQPDRSRNLATDESGMVPHRRGSSHGDDPPRVREIPTTQVRE